MQKDSRLFDDLSRMMSSASNMAFDMKREMEAAIARQLEGLLNKTSLVTREEFEVVKAMAEKAREENDALRKEIEALKAGKQGEMVADTKPKAASKKKPVTPVTE